MQQSIQIAILFQLNMEVSIQSIGKKSYFSNHPHVDTNFMKMQRYKNKL